MKRTKKNREMKKINRGHVSAKKTASPRKIRQIKDVKIIVNKKTTLINLAP